ncbi:hypothetical protein NF212_05625 [Parasalinivibrio latis]|uniref:hypothetical protein n=1 Tax=Parasalinivibrio latis TaxID=2952610 RepID=UPI0030E0BB8F
MNNNDGNYRDFKPIVIKAIQQGNTTEEEMAIIFDIPEKEIKRWVKGQGKSERRLDCNDSGMDWIIRHFWKINLLASLLGVITGLVVF